MVDPAAIAALPDVVLPSAGLPGRRPRLVATGYGGSVRTSFSGSSGFLADAGIANGSLDGAFTLFSDAVPDRALQVRGALWKAQRLLRRESASGFKFSPEFSAHLWRRHLPALAGTDLVNTFQLYSDECFRRRTAYQVRAWFYLDGTLHDYLRGYREYDVAALDPATVDRAIAVERRGYQRADGLAVMGNGTATTLVEEYGVPRERISIVPPGANLSDAMADQVVAARSLRGLGEEFTVGFVGVYPERKGLPKLAEAVASLRREGLPVRLLVVGNCPPAIAAQEGVEALGVLSKTAQPEQFVQALAQMDLGCQLSTVELFGIAVLEYLRCGIPVLATAVGEVAQVLSGGGGTTVPGDAPAEQVADAIRRLADDGAELRRLTAEAQARSGAVRWQGTAARLGQLLDGE